MWYLEKTKNSLLTGMWDSSRAAVETWRQRPGQEDAPGQGNQRLSSPSRLLGRVLCIPPFISQKCTGQTLAGPWTIKATEDTVSVPERFTLCVMG